MTEPAIDITATGKFRTSFAINISSRFFSFITNFPSFVTETTCRASGIISNSSTSAILDLVSNPGIFFFFFFFFWVNQTNNCLRTSYTRVNRERLIFGVFETALIIQFMVEALPVCVTFSPIFFYKFFRL